MASELAQRRPESPRFSERYPWLIAFVFGLLHGFGFAGALSQTGLPKGEVPAALLTFNLGVEVGQLLFIALVLAVAFLGAAMLKGQTVSVLRRAGTPLIIYGIGSLSSFWLLERIAGFWGLGVF